ncbi:class I SAM-dependent rRNA methyltransferase [Hugenholtzia roseola]|uniref:class I SAM-dependent rRNA methyltransferase n=1 Tax=Hugenholtzia roseola TaxID=1002 RepID=UPI00040097EB|nr:class I SAM-dependent rRNA methyltransferase [Hugenholtzia roseola]
MDYPILVLKEGREKSLLQRHPWVFSGAVQKMPKKANNGDIIQVQDHKGRAVGYAFYDPSSQITARVFAFTQTAHDPPLHIDEAFWEAKVQQAFDLRQQHLNFETTNAYRLLHAEGDFLPGIIADAYDKVLVVQLLIKGTELIFPTLEKIFRKLGFSYIFLNVKENVKHLEQLELPKGWVGDTPKLPIIVKENNLLFEIDIENGQKTGFFLDQRENRALLGTYSANKSVLNCFSYTGGFSVYALAAGAKKVDSVDISKTATAICEQVIKLNFEPQDDKLTRHKAIAADCFDYLKALPAESYDVIILDPPAFAKSKKAVQRAARGYVSLNELGFKKVKKGGIVFTFSCSGSVDRDLFRKMVFSAAAAAKREVRIIAQLTQPLDHPVNIYHPEGEYLKGLVLYVE